MTALLALNERKVFEKLCLFRKLFVEYVSAVSGGRNVDKYCYDGKLQPSTNRKHESLFYNYTDLSQNFSFSPYFRDLQPIFCACLLHI